MPNPHILTVVLLALLALLLLLQAIHLMKRGLRRRSHRASQHPPLYAVGSPEYNAHIVNIIYTLNRQLASRGKRLPERTAMDVIQRSTGEEGGPGE